MVLTYSLVASDGWGPGPVSIPRANNKVAVTRVSALAGQSFRDNHTGMIVGIVGSRTHKGFPLDKRCRAIVHYAIMLLDPKDIIMSGGCPVGADYWAKYWAQRLGRQYIEAPPNPTIKFATAAAQRNRTIVKVSDKLLAVWNGTSKGTRIVIESANYHQKPLWVTQL